jgi:hypothetical protein
MRGPSLSILAKEGANKGINNYENIFHQNVCGLKKTY